MSHHQFPFPQVGNIAELYDYDTVFDFLGSGEFATVFKAVRKVTSNNMVAGEEVALKVLPKAKIGSEREVRAIINEVENLRRIRHRHCVVLREALQSDREVFVVMQLVQDSGELFQVVAGTAVNEKCAATITKQILRALRYLHVDRRIIHRDLKPENIMIKPKKCGPTIQPEDIKLTLVDFGLSKYVGSGQRRHTMPRPQLMPSGTALLSANGSPVPLPSAATMQKGMAASMCSVESFDSVGDHTNSPVLTTPVGTMRYSAPETLRGIIENGGSPRKTTRGDLQKTDMYSVGLITHIMLCGQVPFNGRTKAQLAGQMESGPKFSAPRWAKVSPEARMFVEKLLGADPVSRYSAEEALNDPWIVEMALEDEDDAKARPTVPRSHSIVITEEMLEQGAEFDEMISDRNEINNAFNAMMHADAGDGDVEEGDETPTAERNAPPIGGPDPALGHDMHYPQPPLCSGGTPAGGVVQGSSPVPTRPTLGRPQVGSKQTTPSKSTCAYFGVTDDSPLKQEAADANTNKKAQGEVPLDLCAE